MKMEGLYFPETSATTYDTVLRLNLKHGSVNFHRRVNLKTVTLTTAECILHVGLHCITVHSDHLRHASRCPVFINFTVKRSCPCYVKMNPGAAVTMGWPVKICQNVSVRTVPWRVDVQQCYTGLLAHGYVSHPPPLPPQYENLDQSRWGQVRSRSWVFMFTFNVSHLWPRFW